MNPEMLIKMKFTFDTGFNLLVYGVGSKRKLLNDFVAQYFKTKYTTIIVNGFHNGTTFKDI